MSFWVAYSLCTSPCGQVRSLGLTFRLFSTVLVVIDSPLISHADFIMHLMSISFQYDLENCCRFFPSFKVFIIYYLKLGCHFFLHEKFHSPIYLCLHFSFFSQNEGMSVKRVSQAQKNIITLSISRPINDTLSQ